MSSITRSEARTEFLTDILTGAIENYGYGWFVVEEYKWQDPDIEPYAVIMDEDETEYRVDFKVINKGLRVIASSVMRSPEPGQPTLEGADVKVLHNAVTGERLYLASTRKAEIRKADRTNGNEGDLDVVDYLAIVECGLFGKVVYA